jgi:hypothetical protein
MEWEQMKLRFKGLYGSKRFGMTLPELKYKHVAVGEIFECDNTKGEMILQKYTNMEIVKEETVMQEEQPIKEETAAQQPQEKILLKQRDKMLAEKLKKAAEEK